MTCGAKKGCSNPMSPNLSLLANQVNANVEVRASKRSRVVPEAAECKMTQFIKAITSKLKMAFSVF